MASNASASGRRSATSLDVICIILALSLSRLLLVSYLASSSSFKSLLLQSTLGPHPLGIVDLPLLLAFESNIVIYKEPVLGIAYHLKFFSVPGLDIHLFMI